MGLLTWLQPTTVEELSQLLKTRSLRLHGGGTAILRNPPEDSTLIDLSRLEWDSVEVTKDTITIGATATYERVRDALCSQVPDHLLCKALQTAAAPSLRNRITAGGSVAFSPHWSSFTGPLIALDAEVEIVGAAAGKFPVTEYLSNSALRRESAIRSLVIPRNQGERSLYYRFAPVSFSYSIFSLSVLTANARPGRAVIWGTRNRYTTLTGKEITDRAAFQTVEFPARDGFSPDYLKHLASVELGRAFSAIGGKER